MKCLHWMSMLFSNICKDHPIPHSGTHTRLTVTVASILAHRSVQILAAVLHTHIKLKELPSAG